MPIVGADPHAFAWCNPRFVEQRLYRCLNYFRSQKQDSKDHNRNKLFLVLDSHNDEPGFMHWHTGSELTQEFGKF